MTLVSVAQDFIHPRAAGPAGAARQLGLDTRRTRPHMTMKTRASDPASRRAPRADRNDEITEIVHQRLAWAFGHAGYSPEVPDDRRQPPQQPRLET